MKKGREEGWSRGDDDSEDGVGRLAAARILVCLVVLVRQRHIRHLCLVLHARLGSVKVQAVGAGVVARGGGG